MRELLAELTQALDLGRACVFCSVIETRGSTPQKAGAAMLVFTDGSQRGTLGGGCVEAEVRQRALRVLASEGGQPELMTFCLDDNYGWDDGLICGGRMTILADPLASSNANGRSSQSADYYRCFRRLVDGGHGCHEAVVMTDTVARAGSRYLFNEKNQPVAQIAEGPVPDVITRHLVPVFDRPTPAVHQGIAFLPVLPRITLLIVGGGHVGQYVAKLAAEVDFHIWVLDDRAAFVTAERFPTAGRRLIGDIGASLERIATQELNPSVYALIMTRGHSHDEEALYHLATAPAGYVGMIGSKRKIKMIFEDLIARGIPVQALECIHAPLGLPIGSQTVPEIAISIVAELIAHRNLGASSPAPRVRVSVGS
jgi:xanthine dehydrogenase accessory factor